MKSKMQLLFVFAVVSVFPHFVQAQATSRVIPFNNVATTIAPGSTGQALTLQVWDAASGGNLVFNEAQTLDVDANGNISFVLGALTSGGLDPNNFPSGSSRFLDVVDGTSGSVLSNGRLPLNATAFALSPGPQGPSGPPGPKGDPGPPGPVNSVTAGNTSISIGGSVASPTVAVATNGITNANVANGALSPAKIAGTAATLGFNIFTDFQLIASDERITGQLLVGTASSQSNVSLNVGGIRLNALIGDMGCGNGQSGLGSAGFSVGNTGFCTNYSLLGDAQNTFLNRPAGGTLYFRENNAVNQMVIAPGGKVGIGTNTPGARLHVLGNGADVLIGDPGCGAGSQTVAIGFLTNAGLNCGNNFNLGASTLNKETVINRPTGGQISFREGNGPDQMTIAPGGNVTFAGTSSTFDGNVTIRRGIDFGGGIIRQDLSVFGNLNVGGALSVVGRKQFVIDHPLDPANKYLHHAAIESSEVKNMYDGVARLDENGEAVVHLPEWFEALNRDFRYQLTAIGAPAPTLYVAQEISGNRFKIAGGKPGGRVSWQVTGIRQDAYAKAHPMRVEEDKPAADRGYYLSPEVFGQPAEKAIGALRRPRLPAGRSAENAAPR